MKYDVIIVGAGPGGIFSAYELIKQKPDLKVDKIQKCSQLLEAPLKRFVCRIN